jgi:3-oxoacyl-[acyl-carrier protein] reductase
MELELSGKRALVTGSSRGIGFAIAKRLLAEGCSVALNGRDGAALTAAARSIGAATSVVGDVTDADEARRVVAAAAAALGGLDIVICNVGSGRSVPPGDETPEEWQRVFAMNLWSTTNTVAAARAWLEKSQGAIVCVSSICGVELIPEAPVTYSAAKAALHAYVRGIARPLARHNVRINGVAPGNILFDGSVWANKLAADPAKVEALLERDVALRRLGSPEDIAGLVAFLASARAAFATGSIWTLDGGQVHS